jgi:glutathione S-transferase
VRIRAQIARWEFWNAAHFGQAGVTFVSQRLVKKLRGLGAPDPALIARAEADYQRFGAVLDTHLADREWLVGKGLTLADLSVGVTLMYTEAAQLPLAPFANIKRWFAQIEALPEWKATNPPPLQTPD